MSHRVVGTALRVCVVGLALAISMPRYAHAQGQIAIGQTMQSQLTAGSPVNSDGRRYALWTFRGNAGQYVTIDMQSTDIDSYLILQDQNGNELQHNDDFNSSLNSRIQYTLPYSGMYRLMTMSYRTSGVMFGSFTVSVNGAGNVAQPIGQMTSGQIAIGQVMTSQLTGASPVNNENRRYALWTFFGNAGQTVQLDMTSGELDSYLALQDQNGNELQRNDDFGGSLNSRITQTLPYTGTYRIMAMSLRTSGVMFGTYSLSVTGAGMVAQPMANASGVVGQIGLNQQLQGVLGPADARWDNKPFQAYQFQCAAGQTFQMDILSSWDNYALVFDPMGNVVARDDDGGDVGLNARIAHTCTMSGVYRLAVTTYTSSTTAGAYTLQVSGAGAPMIAQPMIQPMIQPMADASGVVGQIAANQQAQNILTQGAARWDSKPFQAYQFQCSAGQTFQMDILSTWDNYALVFDPMGNVVARDDDGGDVGLNARIAHTCTMSGVYRLAVTTFTSSTTPGAYTLQVSSAGAPTMMEVAPQAGVTLPQPNLTGGIVPAGQVASIAFGQMMQGRLEQGDQTMNDGTYADVWTFQGTGGQTVTIDVRSDEFDTYGQLLNASGDRLAEDDDSGGSTNSRITFALPASGQYQIVVNNFGDSRRSGVYSIWLH
jgi:hypothetical protein